MLKILVVVLVGDFARIVWILPNIEIDGFMLNFMGIIILFD